ncbi:MAG: UbiD family decarboxylase [Acidobacteriia bacterium]|nr:UbiD family decarboxylase [Terriglobia bacterium]
MKHINLGSFLDTLRREGELRIIEETVDPHLELAEIQRRTVARQGPALLFTRVARSQFPVATNLFGTRRRIELAFGTDPQKFVRRIVEAAEMLMPPKPSSLWHFRDLLKLSLRSGTRTRRTGPVLERSIEPVRLRALPQIQCWPHDGGPFLTLPLVYTEDPITGKANLGMYRNQIYDDRTAGMHFQIHRGGGFHYHEAERQGQALPVNLFLGGPPALIMSAVAPLPENVPELILASLLQGGRIATVNDPAFSPLPIVAEADFLLVGKIPPLIRRLEGPFGDHYGCYSLAHEFPVLEVERIYHRKDAVFPATVVGRPPQEDHYIGEFLQELFAPMYPLVMNGVIAVWAYDEAGMHPLAAAVVRERYRKEAFMAAMRILGEGQLSLTKFLMVTDARLPLKEFRPLLVHILERADFASDLFILSHVSQDTLDYTSRTLNEGSKAVLMGLGDKRYGLAPELRADLSNPIFRRQRVFAPGVLVVEGPAWRENDRAAEQLLQEAAVESFRLVCLVDDAAECVRDETSFLWTVFTRFEPAADVYGCNPQLRRYHVSMSAPILFDCRLKPWFPPVVEPDPETVKRIDALWSRIF